jgi:hypothetical protein
MSKTHIRILEIAVREASIEGDFPSCKNWFHKCMKCISKLDICGDHSSILTFIFVDLIMLSCRTLPVTTDLGHFTMSDHHIECCTIWDGPLILITDLRIMDLSFL